MENHRVEELRTELNHYLRSKTRFWNHEPLAEQPTLNSSNTRLGKKSFMKYATNSPTPLRRNSRPLPLIYSLA